MRNIRLYYESTGAGSPILAIHAFTFNLRVWDPQRGPLSRKYRFMAFDLRGHGKSPAPAAGYSTLDDLRDMGALIDRLELERLCLIGHSTGANIAAEYTRQNPERIKALILADPLINGMGFPKAWHDAYQAFREIAMIEGVAAGLEKAWIENPVFNALKDDKSKLMFIKDVVRSFSGLPIRENETFPDAGFPPGRPSRITCPTLIIYGENNFDECIDEAERLNREIPKARKVILRGIGHLSHIQKPSTFTREVLQFLSEVF